MPKRRGRPPRALAEVDVDRKIALCVDQLLRWGFSGSGDVFEVVGKAAYDVIGRNSGEGGPLGPDSVKKIHQKFAPPGLERYWPDEMRAAMKPFPKHRMWSKSSLRERAPAGTVGELARMLLRDDVRLRPPTERHWNASDACWEEQVVTVFLGEPEPTAKWAEALSSAPRLKSRVRK